MWTKISSVPSPRVRKPKPRERLNHLTMTISNEPTVAAWARARGAATERRRALPRRDRQYAENLQAALAALRLGDDAGAFVQRREAVAAQNRDVDQHVGFAAIGDDEAVTFCNVEPFRRGPQLQPNLRDGRLRTRSQLLRTARADEAYRIRRSRYRPPGTHSRIDPVTSTPIEPARIVEGERSAMPRLEATNRRASDSLRQDSKTHARA